MNNKISYTCPAGLDSLLKVLTNLELLLRLNIQWHLKEHNFPKAIQSNGTYTCILHHEGLSKDILYKVKVEYRSNPTVIDLSFDGELPQQVCFTIREDNGKTLLDMVVKKESLSHEEQMELNLWIKSIINYAMITESKSPLTKVWKFLLDRFYLRLSPTGRRVVFLVVVSEIFALFFFILLVIYFLYLK
ncbi:MAG: hypothetical protein RMI93_02970 [Caldimicrobium sp.]|nr:hypothetical protein [Caldimicrobium sp.]MDW8182554.1 hypothetical protein [Caldimicrobium sp.]